MAIKVTRVADIVGKEIIISDQRKYNPGDIAAILTNLLPVSDPNTEFQWKLELLLGVGAAMRRLLLDLPCLISNSDCLDSPLFLGDGKIIYFRHRLYIPE